MKQYLRSEQKQTNGVDIMSMNYSSHFNTVSTPQNCPIPGQKQVKNNAGGFVYELDDLTRLTRFLVLGTEGGTYYASERKLTVENGTFLMELIKNAGEEVVKKVVEISKSGRAPKNDPALFVLAMCMKLGDLGTKRAAREALPEVARIGTHLFHFAEYLKAFGGWGRNTKGAISDWYTKKDVKDLAMQIVKYQQRDGWSHADLIRLAHVKPGYGNSRQALLQYAGARYTASTATVTQDYPELSLLAGVEAIKLETSPAVAASLIADYKLPREVVPTELLNHSEVWEALLPHMGLTALIRNLATMTRVGLIAPLSDGLNVVLKKLLNSEDIKRSRVHPIQVLSALMTYSSGRGFKGTHYWTPVQQVVDALDTAFYASFGNVVPCNKNLLIGLDVSGSMQTGSIAGVAGLTPAVASAALCLVTAATETNYHIIGFSTHPVELKISPKQRLEDVIKYMYGRPFGGTDCSLPMQIARKEKLKVDGFLVYTDNETWCGSLQPSQALAQYRKASGINSKSVVVGMTSTGFTIADPNDKNSMDVVGFDTATPQLISDFIRE